MLDWSYYNPVRLRFSSLGFLADYVTGQRILLVTTQGFAKRGVVNRIECLLAPREVVVWSGVTANPKIESLNGATQKFAPLAIDSVIGLGGGSSIDAAKVISTMIPLFPEYTLEDILLKDLSNLQKLKRLPLVVIPTTSGTGSEVTPFATVWDRKNGKKYSLVGEYIVPDIAILDSTLTLTLDADDTLYPALDSISHALESIWNRNCTLITKTLALKSLDLSNRFLREVIRFPSNLEGRRALQEASLLSGLAISQTRTAIAHSISYPLTGNLGIPHGLACSFTLPRLIAANLDLMTITSEERDIITETFKLLESLDLVRRIRGYTDDEALVALASEMYTENRALNYIGNLNLGTMEAFLREVLGSV